jgi:DNA-binding response OmpR family regulator
MFTVLIIDDEPTIRQSLALILHHAGYQTTTAGRADEVRQYLQTGSFDLVILDLKMPDVDGLTLLAEIRGLYPDMSVFILTAHGSLESAIEAMRCGARDYMLKPIVPDRLLARVHEIIAEHQLPRRRLEIATHLRELIGELYRIDAQSLPSAPVAVARAATTVPDWQADPSRYLQRGALMLDLHANQAFMHAQPIPLPPSSFAYLVTLVRHSPDPVSCEILAKESQGYEALNLEVHKILRWQIHALRKALEENVHHPQHILTVRKVGYRLVV